MTLKKHSQQSGKRWTPDKEQLLGVQWLVSRAAAALFLDPGAGKTSITYAAITVLKREGIFQGALVVAPLRPATSTWPEEQQNWTDFHGLDVVVLHGKHKDKLVRERHDVYVVNYEGLAWLIAKGHLKMLLKNKWICTLVLDELSKMKNASKKAVRRKLLWTYLPLFARRWGLTGSPAANGLINLFGQVNVLDLGAAFGPYITHFRNMFFTQVSEWKYVLKEGAEQLIYDRIAPLALRTVLGKNVKVPELRQNIIRVELPPDARKAYDEMEEQMLTILDDDLIAAGSAGSVYGKCCQIATGALFKAVVDPVTGEPRVKGNGPREWYNLHDAKLDALEELIDELQGQQLLTAYWFKHDLEKLHGRFGKKIPYIGSGVSVKEAVRIEAAWNAGDIPLLFGHPQSMAHGLNFQKSNAHHVAWYTPTPDYELYDQFCRRLCRRGNKSKIVWSHILCAARTVETWGIVPSLGRKNKTQGSLFEALRLLSRGLQRESSAKPNRRGARIVIR